MNVNKNAPEAKLKIEMRPVASLIPYVNNPRKHNRKQIRRIADSIRKFDWTNPILIDAQNGVIAGHGRLEAAKLLGWKQVPTIRLDHMTEAEKRAYIIADNQLAALAGWDEDLLRLELGNLLEADLDFDVEITGFDTIEIDRLMGFTVEGAADEEELELPEPGAPPVTRPGDAWTIGPHRLVCGDARDAGAWETLLGGRKADMVFTDPPYNVRIQGNVSGLGAARHREFAMASGEMSPAEFTGFLRGVFEQLCENAVDGAIHFVCMDWRHISEILEAGRVYAELKNLIVWAKTNAGMGAFYRSQHELVFAFKSGTAPHRNNFGLGGGGRHRSNLWTYPGVNVFRAGRMQDLEAHPTVKPVAMIADAILDCSPTGGLVVDAFAGSGSTLIAAARSGRVGAAIEIDPTYADLAVTRLAAEIGDTPRLDDGRSFEEARAQRDDTTTHEEESSDDE